MSNITPSLYTFDKAISIEYEIKKSRFIAYAIPTTRQQDAVKEIHQITLEHPQANHVAYAYCILNETGTMTVRFHDAGEPSGTAGRPILAYLEGAGLVNSSVIVVRYFGGVKLGTGGLSRAYGMAAKRVIEKLTKSPLVKFTELTMQIEYCEIQNLEYQLQQLEGKIVKQDFSDRVDLIISLPEANVATFRSVFPVR